jgi:putative effector of murein hydrolase LrgA (UPF0299 family)
MAVIFTPAGVFVVRASFYIENAPHIFVMYIFSGSLMILLGLAGVGGLLLRDKTPPSEKL